MIDLKTALFIVDGKTEIRSFRKKFETQSIQSPDFIQAGVNGKDVTPEAYVNPIYARLQKALKDRYRHIICILDREERTTPAVKFGVSVLEEIKRRLLKDFNEEQLKKITVVVSDRCFENWIVADIEGIKNRQELILQHNNQDNFEGRNGVAILERIMLKKYKKTTHAEILFNCVRFDVARKNSKSFDLFCSAINYP
ncbi:MAG: DUF4276 family protein [Nitrospirae bacterium]|uniref:DUF4276 family protein n=1 Tax=Candidatus Magnetobacterium casense TaxID=1455061 RepID=UPI00059074B2|nr:DUF4276 family protein [Candidatus Magnetobacterium casensis]MBF0336450.1 DUF4276 family protein [Nitrospirota bacterium]